MRFEDVTVRMCPSCYGARKVACPACRGRRGAAQGHGYGSPQGNLQGHAQGYGQGSDCLKCLGSGQIRCATCDGQGRVPV